MIRKLRWKFVIINMSFVALVLLAVFASSLYSSVRQMQQKIDLALSSALNASADDAKSLYVPKIDARPDSGGRRESWPLMPTFTVLLDSETNEITQATQQNIEVSDAVMRDAVAQALAESDGSGRLPAYDFCYAARYSSAGTKIAFADASARYAELEQQAWNSLIIGFAGMLAFFGVSVFLSRVTLRPVERAWEQQRQFVADASHELKTPLTVILANTDILLTHPEQTVGEQRRWVENTRAEGMRMKGLVDDLLYLARADIAVPETQAAFSLSDAVWGAALPFEAVAFENGVRLNTDIQDGVSLYGNEKEIRQLVAILLDNAIKYAGASGVATVRLLAESDAIRLHVQNTGVPIDPADLPHIFERFYRAEGSRDRRTGGYGLGLAIAENIARTNRASISAASGAEEGTVFTVEWKGRAQIKERAEEKTKPACKNE